MIRRVREIKQTQAIEKAVMTDRARQTGKNDRRAAAYVRTATEDGSLTEQIDTIGAYARARGIEIVETFEDRACGGHTLEGRKAFPRMLRLVQSGDAGFSMILLLDPSRWGRFQDPDQMVCCEKLFTDAGVTVHYCAPPLADAVEPAPAERESPRRERRLAALYLRCARQEDSIEAQTAALEQHASSHGLEIVRTFTDRGHNGSGASGREAFEEMLSLVDRGRAEFEEILVYDRTHWGRFGVDEAAYYEALCRRGRVVVRYVADGEDARAGKPGSLALETLDDYEKCALELEDLLTLLARRQCDVLFLYRRDKNALDERELAELGRTFEHFGVRVHPHGMEMRES